MRESKRDELRNFIQAIQRLQPMLITAVLVIGAVGVCGCGAERTKQTDVKQSAVAPFLLDDYEDAKRNKSGAERLLIDDKAAGSQSRAAMRCEDGVMSVQGELIPGRGVPAFISQVSLLSADGKPKDMTGYEGVRLRVKTVRGPLSVQVATATITNFDFHASAPIAGKGGEFREVRVPFTAMKRAWSEQTALDLKNVTSVNLVSFGLAKDSFAYAVDEIGFY